MFPILEYVQFNQARTLQEEGRLNQRMERLAHENLGRLVSEGMEVSDAQPLAAAQALDSIGEPYQWYNVNPAKAYTAALQYLVKNYDQIATYAGMSEGELVGIVMGSPSEERWLAGFVARARASTVQEILSIPVNDYQLGYIPYKDLGQWDGIHDTRNQVLEAVRHFVTEALHQTVGMPIGVHIEKVEDWKLS